MIPAGYTAKQWADIQAMHGPVRRWAGDPVAFVRECFGVEPYPHQAELLRDVCQYDRIAVRSGHGSGKTTTLGWAILWWLATRSPAKIACTANKASQLEDVLWSEIRLWHGKMPELLRKEITIQSDKVFLTEAPGISFAVARTARKENPEAFQGFHSEHMLFIAEEASGIDDVIFQVGEGAMSTPGAKTILAGNPTRSSGYFFDAFHKMQGRWRRHHWDCEVISRNFPKQVAPQFIEDMARKHGTESNVYRFRVKGDVPKTEDDAVIPLGWIEDAQRRDVEPAPGYLPVWGLDVARFGDDRTALAKRRHNVLLEPLRYWHGKDTMQVSGLVLHEYEAAKKAGAEPHEILVDVIGIGAGVVDRMRELGLPVRGVNVSESASVKANYLRLRDELWWRAREWFEQRDCRLPPVNDDVKDGTDAMEILVSELSQPKYTATSGGKILVETKDDMKKRGLLSPDLADAFCLTFAGGYAKTDQHDRYSPRGRYDQQRTTSWMAA